MGGKDQLGPKYILKVKLHKDQNPNIVSEIIKTQENGGCCENLAQNSNWHLHTV